MQTGSTYGQTGTKPTAGSPWIQASIFSRMGSKVIHCKRRLRCLEKAWDTPRKGEGRCQGRNRTPEQYRMKRRHPGCSHPVRGCSEAGGTWKGLPNSLPCPAPCFSSQGTCLAGPQPTVHVYICHSAVAAPAEKSQCS